MTWHGTSTAVNEREAMIRDIVCGMDIEEDDSRTVVKTSLDKTYYFCSAECMLTFIKDPGYFRSGTNDGETAIDLVCGMNVDKNSPPYFVEYKGIRFYFCSHACREQFESSPKQYVGA